MSASASRSASETGSVCELLSSTPEAGPMEAIHEQRACGLRGPHGEVEQSVRIGGRQEWRGPDLNRRHPGFQPSALPAELPRRGPHQATTWLRAARQSNGSRNSTSSPIARRSSLAASPPLMQSAAAPAESTRTTRRPAARRRTCGRAALHPVGSPRTATATALPAASPLPRDPTPRGQRAVAEAVHVHAGRPQQAELDSRAGEVSRTSAAGSTLSPSARRRVAQRKPAGRRREDVAAVERRRGIGRNGELVCRLDAPGALAAATSRPLSGPTKSLPSALCSTRARRSVPTPGSITATWMPTGHVRDGIGERSRARRDVPWRHAVSEVEHARVRRDAEDRTLHDAGVVSRVPKSDRSVTSAHESTLPAPRTLSMPRMRTSR